jgi:hypothetical protein
VLKPIGEFVAKETLDIVKNTVLSNGAAVADVNMDFNRKTFEKYIRKINQEIAKEINDFCSGLMYSSTLTLEAMGCFLLVIWKDDQFTKTLAKILQRLKFLTIKPALAMRIAYESGNHTVWTNEDA